MLFTEETQRLILKVENEDKAQQVLDFYIRNRDYFTPFEPQVMDSFYTPAYHEKMLAYEFQEIMKGTALRYFLYLKSDPEHLIGCVNLAQIIYGSFRRASLGYKLDKDMSGFGYASEAVIKLLDIAASELKLHRIEAHVVPNNLASVRLLERLHFQREGMEYQSTLVNGFWSDLLRYSLLLY